MHVVTPADTVLELNHVSVVRGDRTILCHIDWTVCRDERWVVLGPNGSGKTTLCRVASLYLHPTSGEIDVLGRRLGQTDVRELRTHLGFTSAALAPMLRNTLRVADVVVTGKHAALAPYWHTYSEADYLKAQGLLARFGCDAHREAEFGTLSSGERQRVLLARTLMSDPALLLLDEPTAGLDLGGREDLVDLLSTLASDKTAPATIMVTHHVDEIPPGFTHALLLRDGRVSRAGRLEAVVNDDNLTACFGRPLRVEHRNGRWSARG